MRGSLLYKGIAQGQRWLCLTPFDLIAQVMQLRLEQGLIHWLGLFILHFNALGFVASLHCAHAR